MPSFSATSEHQLSTCDQRLQTLFEVVVLYHDCTVIEGYRPPDKQLEDYNSGNSKVKFGKHNESPSKAADVGPYIPGRGIPWPKTPTDWNNKGQRERYMKDLAQFYFFAGAVMAIASHLGIQVRWGGDWDRDHDLADQSFDDLVHFELYG